MDLKQFIAAERAHDPEFAAEYDALEDEHTQMSEAITEITRLKARVAKLEEALNSVQFAVTEMRKEAAKYRRQLDPTSVRATAADVLKSCADIIAKIVTPVLERKG